MRRQVIDALISLFNKQVYPVIPGQGFGGGVWRSGAAGAYGSSAHWRGLATVHRGIHHHRQAGDAPGGLGTLRAGSQGRVGAAQWYAGLNGTCTAGIVYLRSVFDAALVAGSLSVEAAQGSRKPFDERIHEVRGLPAQQQVAAKYRELLGIARLRKSHENCSKVQDPIPCGVSLK